MRRIALIRVGLAVLVAGGAATVIATATAEPPARPSAGANFETSRCATGYSSGLETDYFAGNGEPFAAAATQLMSNLVRRQQGPVHARTVKASSNEIVTQYLSQAGTVVAQGAVVQVGNTWRIGPLAQCAPSMAEQPAENPTRLAPRVPRLLLSKNGPDTGSEALVHGTLRVDAAGCLSLDKRPLIAPRGASMSSDGRTLQMPDGARLTIGQWVTGAGGYTDLPAKAVPAEYHGCSTTKLVAATRLWAPSDPAVPN